MTDTYKTAIKILKDATRFGICPTLETVEEIISFLGNPQRQYSVIQVAGTNGKTSTSRFIAAILRACGKRVGLYTSPELVFLEERIEIDGVIVDREQFAKAILDVNDAARNLILQRRITGITEFELLTVAALLIFARSGVSHAVLEVGLGGRWDATNVASANVAVITGVDLDHTDILGDTIELIAAEKAAIIKPGSVAVLGRGSEVAGSVFAKRIEEVAAAKILVSEQQRIHSEYFAKLRYDGAGYQSDNIACAISAAAAVLGYLPDINLMTKTLANFSIPGRYETLRKSPLLLIDAAHNPQSAQILADELKRFPVKLTLLLGILADKDADGIIRALAPVVSDIVVTSSASARAIPVDELARLVEQITGILPKTYPDVGTALAMLTGKEAGLIATGSITIAGEVKRYYIEHIEHIEYIEQVDQVDQVGYSGGEIRGQM